MSAIDFKKVDAAFAHLANDPSGPSQLAQFAAALDHLRRALPNLNANEAQYVASALLQQRVGAQSAVHFSAGAKTVHGFVIKPAVN
jgi:hypothetical protein